MKLHHLTFEGIGPFEDRISLDLDQLGASGIFLLQGPTGSGKSTIIDAIVYALYGQVAGENSSGDRIRSHFADPSKESFVDLFFEVPDGIYRVRRTPAFKRPKKRGKGETHQNVTAKLWKLSSPEALAATIAGKESSGAIEPIATKADDVGRKIADAIGLTCEQFTQTVVLPQGEFARFLRSNTNERKAVLERVFGTGFYQVVEDTFVQARKRAHRSTEASISELRTGFGRVIEAAGLDDDAARMALAEAGSFSPEAVDKVVAFIDFTDRDGEASIRRATNAEEAARKTVATAETEAAFAAGQQDLLKRRRSVDGKIAQRDSSKKATQEAARALRAHEQAEKAFYALTERDKARARLHDAAAKLPPAIRENPETWKAALDTATAQRDQTAESAAALKAVAEAEARLPEKKAALHKAESAKDSTENDVRSAQSALAERPKQRESLLETRRRLASAAEPGEKHALASEDLRRRIKAATAAVQETTALSSIEKQLAKETEAAKAAVENEARLRQARIESIAAELALDLEPGAACPVCGSSEHPEPAQTDAQLVTQEAIDAAEEQRRNTDAAVQKSSQRRASISAALDSALSAAGIKGDPGAGLKDLEAALTTTNEALQAARQASQDLTEVEEQLAAFDENTAAATDRLNDARVQAERAATEAATLARNLAEEEKRIREAAGDDTSVASKRARLLDEAKALGDDVSARASAEQALVQEKELALAADAEVKTSGQDDEAGVRAARLPDARRKELDAQVRAWDNLASQISEALNDPQLAEFTITDQKESDIEAAVQRTASRLSEAREEHTAAAAARQSRERVVQRTSAAITAFRQAVADHQRTAARNAALVHLANVATGNSADTHAKLRLSTYVVMRRFEAVVEAANVRLAAFSRSTLELAICELESGGSKHVGLDLEVIDRRTDKRRAPATLSGGESFFVSLALALGLADIVTGESGGTEMNTLFIDEGFGSLDPEALDSVVAEIRNLARHGRTVGVVSHVSEMATQIPEKIEVRRLPSGRSSAIVVI